MIPQKAPVSNWKPERTRAKSYTGRIVGISPPYPDRGLRDCPKCTQGKISVNNQVVNCPECEGTGKQMEQKILLTYELDKADKNGNATSQAQERVKDSLFPGGEIQGQVLSPATYYKRICVLYGISPGSDIDESQIDPQGDISETGFPQLVLLVDGYKIFDIRLYQGATDKIHEQAPPKAPAGTKALQDPLPRLRPATSPVGPGNGTPAVAVPDPSKGPEEDEADVPF